LIRWEPPAEEARNGPIIGYKIKYRKPKKQSLNRADVQTETTPGNVKFYELKNLEPMTPYQIRIAAMTINGTGPFSEWSSVDTYEFDLDESRVPGEPSWIKTKANADSILVSWGAPVEQDIKVRGYILGWGIGIPDEYTHEFDENTRNYEIPGLNPNLEYVLSLRARNLIGDGIPKYDSARTKEEIIPESLQPMDVPVGLRALTMSGSSILVLWTDNSLGKSQHVKDNRVYTIRYSSTGSTKYRYKNSTELSCMITDLKSNTVYEFEVKVTKGKRESMYSMSVLNSTMSTLPATPPRDLVAKMLDDKTPLSVLLTWNPPKNANSPITNYVILYSTDSTRADKDWLYENVPADKTSVIINQLSPHTTYYFKVQAKYIKSPHGSFSAMVSHTTGAYAVDRIDSIGQVISKTNVNISSQTLLILVGALILASLIIVTTVLIICCRKKPQETPDHKKSYQKNPASVIKPPDLWIHHDHIELKNVEKINLHQTTPGCSDGASSSGVMTLPRSVGHDFENETQFPSHVSNSLDKRTYVPGYMSEYIFII
jgi:neogenin